MDILFIKSLQVEAVIGAYDWEREIRQTLILDIEMQTDVARPAQSDALGDVPVDYDRVASFVREYVEATQHHLIEALADSLADKLLAEFSIPWLRLTVEKPRPADSYRAGIVIERAS